MPSRMTMRQVKGMNLLTLKKRSFGTRFLFVQETGGQKDGARKAHEEERKNGGSEAEEEGVHTYTQQYYQEGTNTLVKHQITRYPAK